VGKRGEGPTFKFFHLRESSFHPFELIKGQTKKIIKIDVFGALTQVKDANSEEETELHTLRKPND